MLRLHLHSDMGWPWQGKGLGLPTRPSPSPTLPTRPGEREWTPAQRALPPAAQPVGGWAGAATLQPHSTPSPTWLKTTPQDAAGPERRKAHWCRVGVDMKRSPGRGWLGKGPENPETENQRQDALPLHGLRLGFEPLLTLPLFLYPTSVSRGNAGGVTDGAARAHDARWTLSTMPPPMLCTFTSRPRPPAAAAICASERWRGARQHPARLLTPPPDLGGAQKKDWAGLLWPGRGPEQGPGSPWSTGPCSEVWPCPGAQIQGSGPQAHLGHLHICPPTPLPSQGGADVAWPPPYPHFWSQTPAQRKEDRRGREGSLPQACPGKGCCPLLWGKRPRVCKLPGQLPVPHCGTPAWALTRGCGWSSAAPGQAHRPEPTSGLSMSGWLGQGWQGTSCPGLGAAPPSTAGNSKHCTLKPKAP